MYTCKYNVYVCMYACVNCARIHVYMYCVSFMYIKVYIYTVYIYECNLSDN